MTVPRYIAIVALIYLAAFAAVLAFAGHFDVRVIFSLPRLWVFPLGAVGIAVLGTLAPIARFGYTGGSKFALPSILHSVVILSLLIATLVALR
jgi:hypothetical protein